MYSERRSHSDEDMPKSEKDSQGHKSRTAKLRIWTLRICGIFGPRVPFWAADALWGGVTHAFREEAKERFCKSAVCKCTPIPVFGTVVPFFLCPRSSFGGLSFRFSYPCSGFWYGGTSAKPTLLRTPRTFGPTSKHVGSAFGGRQSSLRGSRTPALKNPNHQHLKEPLEKQVPLLSALGLSASNVWKQMCQSISDHSGHGLWHNNITYENVPEYK